MPQFYVYLISSLPMLHFGAKPPLSTEKFLDMCKGFVPDEDLAVIASVGAIPTYEVELAKPDFNLVGWNGILKKWLAFDTALRNELVKIRAAKKHIDPALYMRQDGYAEPSVTHLALAATRDPSIIEAEKILDQERWHFLDEFSVGHYFDLDLLIIYILKLQILERWAKVNSADPVKEVRQLC